MLVDLFWKFSLISRGLLWNRYLFCINVLSSFIIIYKHNFTLFSKLCLSVSHTETRFASENQEQYEYKFEHNYCRFSKSHETTGVKRYFYTYYKRGIGTTTIKLKSLIKLCQFIDNTCFGHIVLHYFVTNYYGQLFYKRIL